MRFDAIKSHPWYKRLENLSLPQRKESQNALGKEEIAVK
jgi:hypothetical protein